LALKNFDLPGDMGGKDSFFSTACSRSQPGSRTQGIDIEFIEPGNFSHNGHIERLNGIYSEAVLDTWMFTDLHEVREAIEQ
jgi:hypothetical protein